MQSLSQGKQDKDREVFSLYVCVVVLRDCVFCSINSRLNLTGTLFEDDSNKIIKDSIRYKVTGILK